MEHGGGRRGGGRCAARGGGGPRGRRAAGLGVRRRRGWSRGRVGPAGGEGGEEERAGVGAAAVSPTPAICPVPLPQTQPGFPEPRAPTEGRRGPAPVFPRPVHNTLSPEVRRGAAEQREAPGFSPPSWSSWSPRGGRAERPRGPGPGSAFNRLRAMCDLGRVTLPFFGPRVSH